MDFNPFFTLFLLYLDIKCIFFIQAIQHSIAGALEVLKTIGAKNEHANLFVLGFHIAVVNIPAVNFGKGVNKLKML